jgi:hypothetical protein
MPDPLAVFCPRCKAEPDKPCRGGTTHPERRALAGRLDDRSPATLPLTLWQTRTLATACPVCAAARGERCRREDGGERRHFHLRRYELAREQAGQPLRRKR